MVTVHVQHCRICWQYISMGNINIKKRCIYFNAIKLEHQKSDFTENIFRDLFGTRSCLYSLVSCFSIIPSSPESTSEEDDYFDDNSIQFLK